MHICDMVLFLASLQNVIKTIDVAGIVVSIGSASGAAAMPISILPSIHKLAD